ncbi:recombinase family protein [Streptomyces spongiae]|nr:recombinase family protein [Streptomyces spongiae]
MRIAVYLRLSRDNGGSTSIESQREDCYALCAKRGWDVVIQGQDVDVSGTTPHTRRPGLAGIMARRHEFDVLLVARPDRLARSVPNALEILDALSDTDTSVVASDGPLDTTVPAERAELLRAIALAERESTLIQTRIARSRLALQHAERWIGGNAPYGYRIVPDGAGGKRLAEHEETAPRMRWIVEQILTGETVTAVCDSLNAEGIPSPATTCSRAGKVSQWSPTVLRRMLRSPALLGHRTVGQGRERLSATDVAGNPVRVGPPLIDPQTWDSLQTTLESRSRTPQRPRLRSSLLLHVAQCAECDARLHYNTRRYIGDGSSNDVYRCSGGCKVLISATRLEDAVRDWALDRFGSLPFVARLPCVSPPEDSSRDRLHSDVGELARRLVGLYGPAAEAVQRQLEAHSATWEMNHPINAACYEWSFTGKTVADEWEARGPGGRREVLLALGVRVAVRPANNQRRWSPERLALSATGPGAILLQAFS